MTEHYYYKYEQEDTPVANRCEPIVAEAIKRIDEIEHELAEMRHYTVVMKGKLNGLRTWLTQEHSKKKEIERKEVLASWKKDDPLYFWKNSNGRKEDERVFGKVKKTNEDWVWINVEGDENKVVRRKKKNVLKL
jgi:hypothetical protein